MPELWPENFEAWSIWEEYGLARQFDGWTYSFRVEAAVSVLNHIGIDDDGETLMKLCDIAAVYTAERMRKKDENK